ncbi:MAG TPA: rod shape-determining protein RodA [Bacteroidia bacterium]|jgi:rod shape determining protein RodA|nr:rod shape-determining protein RodA [Bacteroidia bacterium]
MTDRRNNILPYVDWVTISIYALLVIIGWLNIYSAVYNPAHPAILDNSQRYGKQFIWVISAFVLAFLIMLSDASFFSVFAYLFYGITFLALIAVIFVGRNISGSHSWFRIGSVGIQPAELGIFAINLGLAKYLSNENIKMNQLGVRLRAMALLVVPMIIIIAQNETGVAITYTSFIFVLYREGLSGNILLTGFLTGVLFILALVSSKLVLSGILIGIAVVAFVFFTRRKTKDLLRVGGIMLAGIGILWGTNYAFSKLEPHQRKRIEVFLHQNVNKNKEGYNLNQAEIAIGSGGFFGKGYLQGTQTKFHFVPEQATDFIFCTLCEEWGFVGASVVIIMFLTLMIRIIFLAERQRSAFSRIYGYGVASILFIHIAVNIGMTLGLIPVIGIPLPFISYGGSSLWAFTILLFIFLRLDANRLQILK